MSHDVEDDGIIATVDERYLTEDVDERLEDRVLHQVLVEGVLADIVDARAGQHGQFQAQRLHRHRTLTYNEPHFFGFRHLLQFIRHGTRCLF